MRRRDGNRSVKWMNSQIDRRKCSFDYDLKRMARGRFMPETTGSKPARGTTSTKPPVRL